MTKSTQVVVLGGLLAVIVVFGGWRTWSAIQETKNLSGAKNKSPAEWLKHFKFEPIAAADRALPDTGQVFYLEGAGLQLIPLGKGRWRDLMPRLDRIEDAKGIPFPMFNQARALHANALVKGTIDEQGEELEPGEGWLNVTFAFLHAGKVPFASMPRPDQALCVLTKVDPGSEGEKAGLKRGDLLVSAGEVDLAHRVAGDHECNELVAAIERFKAGESYTMTVVQDGTVRDVPRVGGQMFGLTFREAPVLDEDLTR